MGYMNYHLKDKEIIERRYFENTDLNKSVQFVKIESFYCPYCNLIFHNKEILYEHIKNKHNITKAIVLLNNKVLNSNIVCYVDQIKQLSIQLYEDKLNVFLNNKVYNRIDEKVYDKIKETFLRNHNNISHVLLTGGTCYIPAVQKKMKEKFGHRVETVQNADLLIAQGAAVIGELGWMPFLTKDILIQLADNSYWPIFEKGMPISSKEEAHRSENFLTTDSSNKIAKVLVYEGMNQRTDKMLTVLNIPIPGRRSYGDEIVIEAIIDKDIILKIRGYSYVAIYPGMSRNEATSIRINKEVYQLCF